MNKRSWHLALALLVTSLAVLPQAILGSVGAPSTLLLLLAAVVFSSRYGDISAGVLAAGEGSLITWLLFSPSHASDSARLAALAQLFTFILVAISTGWIVRRAGRQLRLREGLLTAMSGDPGAGMIAVDTSGRLTFMNDAASAMLGWSGDELEGKSLLPILRPRGAQAGDTTLAMSRGGEDEFVHKDGSVIPVWAMTSPIMVSGTRTGSLLSFRDLSEKKRQERALSQSEERYRRLVETLPHAVFVTDGEGTILTANARAADLWRYERAADMCSLRMAHLIAPAGRGALGGDLKHAMSGAIISDREYAAVRQDTSPFPVELAIARVAEGGGDSGALILVARDLTERKEAEAAIRFIETRQNVQHMAAATLAISVTAGEAFSNILETICTHEGWDAGAYWKLSTDRSGLRCAAMYHVADDMSPGFRSLMHQLTLVEGEDIPGRVMKLREPIWIEDVRSEHGIPRAFVLAQAQLGSAVCVPVFSAGDVYGVLEFFCRDTRPHDPGFVAMLEAIGAQLANFLERKEAERALEYQASHDPLTDLPNRSLLQRRLHGAIGAAIETRSSLALLLLDLDRFKEINDTLGHHYGDLLLREVASRLMSVLRESDTVARLGGDEFAVLLPQATAGGASTVALTILSTLSQPIWVEGQRLDIWGSVGISLFPDHASDADTLMQRADIAMYSAKRAKSGCELYAADQDQHSADRLDVIAALRRAIENDSLTLHYQPKVNFATGEIDSVEALVRWQDPTRGLVPPDEFIPLAEQTGLIAPLTWWVLRAAVRQCRIWQEGGMRVRVAVNLSAQNLHDPKLADTVRDVLQAEHLAPACLALEITESAIMVDSNRALATLNTLHDMGVSIAIDDFGTGYSSLAYLQKLPVDEIKIDRSFVKNLSANSGDAYIAQTVIDLGHNLGLSVVAEGVQSQEIWNRLRAMNCDVCQGYYAARPLPARELVEWLHGDPPAGMGDRTESIELNAS